ncbi:hypothetical protein CU633_05385 [Bacillus sp. V3-13]|uniref:hypothetical protein n=1 Tax=Bacillus sp. V3-13 TaxID=2053728 RepID=UPI000C75FE3B|nr:hypothetical protein [Bacillus sp. V3-13]PLR78413.1 hypothetical protein CU633_05385 [Bacillus sp. V3-13]
MEELLKEILVKLDGQDKRFDQMEKNINERFEQFDNRFEQMEKNINERFEQFDNRFEQMEKNMNERFEEVDKGFDQMEKRFDKLEERLEITDVQYKDDVLTLLHSIHKRTKDNEKDMGLIIKKLAEHERIINRISQQ